MKVWAGLCLLALLTSANAYVIEVSADEDIPGNTTAVRQEESGDSHHSENFITLNREEVSKNSQDEKEEPSTFFFSSHEIPSPPGGGFRRLDPKFLNIMQPFPVQVTWWEYWWGMAQEWTQVSSPSSKGLRVRVE
jgi:hypothetical protein